MGSILVAALLGAFTWTLMEYVLHRWLGHDPRTRPNAFATEHVRHHGEGNYFAPAWKKGAAAVVTTAVLAGPAVWIAGASAGMAYVLGFVGMYLGYEVMHRREHTHPGFGPYARWARRHHFHHHFTNPKVNHGVTTPIWDFVFAAVGETTRTCVFVEYLSAAVAASTNARLLSGNVAASSLLKPATTLRNPCPSAKAAAMLRNTPFLLGTHTARAREGAAARASSRPGATCGGRPEESEAGTSRFIHGRATDVQGTPRCLATARAAVSSRRAARWP